MSGNFLFDDSVSPIVTPNGSFFGNASPSFSITVGNEVFTGLSNSIVVDSDFQAPSVPLSDLIIFDDFSDFNPQDPANNVFLGLFIYPPDAFQSEDLPATVPPTALATITTPTGETLFSPEAATSITAVPEPTTLFSLGVVGTLGAISVAKKTGFKGGKREN
ncbi:MAG: PEP-CTERM sorting domain-containing protein [Cyanobacteriota bacterium]|nr:PEP-CTERM sorting domain-containing protein [Cyanobacteriota bacterium]